MISGRYDITSTPVLTGLGYVWPSYVLAPVHEADRYNRRARG